MADYDEKDRIKVPIFEGDKAQFREWDIRWNAYARTKGYTDIINGKVKVPKFDKKNMTDEEEELVELNYQGYARLLMKVGKFAFETVAYAKTAELPEGDLKKAYDDLKLVYQPKNTAELVEIKTAFANCTLEDFRTNPDDWFCQLNQLAERQKQQGAGITEEDIMAHILSRMPDQYKDLRTSVTTLLNSDPDAVNLLTLKVLMRQHWEKYSSSKGSKKADEAFFTSTYKKQFKGQCRNCGKIGHKSFECRSPKNTPSGNSRGTPDSGNRSSRDDTRKCFKCGKTGHMKANCPTRQHGNTERSESTMFLGMLRECSDYTVLESTTNKEDDGWEHIPIKPNRWVKVEDLEAQEYNTVVKKTSTTPVTSKLFWADWCEDSSEEDDNIDVEAVFMTTGKPTNGSNKWLADTGSTVHCTNDEAYLPVKETCERGIIIGDSTTMRATHQGTATITTDKGQDINLEDCLLVPDLDRNIIAITKFSDKGHKIDIEKDNIKVWDRSNEDFILFERNENLFYLTGKPRATNDVAMTMQHLQSGIDIDYNTAHSILGHIGKSSLEKTVKNIGWKLSGHLSTCESCAKAKAIAKGVSKTGSEIEQKPGDRMYVDISGPYPTTVGGSKYWVMAVDGHSRMKFSGFITRKSEIAKFVEGILGKMKTFGHKVKLIRCDNAGENNKQLRLLAEQHEIVMEFTAPHTPQQNGVAERAIAVVKEMALAMMIAAGINLEGRQKLWAEAINAATDVANILSTSVNDTSAFELLTGFKPDQVYKYLQPFGRVGYVTDRTKIKGKLTERSTKCMYVGHAKNHAGDVYRMYNPETNSTLFSRDVKWHEWHGHKGPTDDLALLRPDVEDVSEREVLEDKANRAADPPIPNIHVIPDEELDEGRTTFDDGDDGHEVDDDVIVASQPKSTTTSTSSSSGQGRNKNQGVERPVGNKLSRELRRLNIDMTVGPNKERPVVIEMDPMEVQMAIEYVYSTLLASDPGTPRTYKDAMKSFDVEYWIDGIKVEFGNFTKRQVHRTLNRKKLKHGDKVLKCRWVFKKKIKEDGTVVYRARLVVKGYEQIPGVDYTESFAPTANDTTTRIVIVYAMSKREEGWVIDKIDIETAFLEAELDEDDRVFVEIPDGIEWVIDDLTDATKTEEYKRNNVWLLTKAMYGLVQAPRKFYEKFRRVLTSKDVGMVVSEVDPCMYYKFDSQGTLVAILIHHVDDAIITGHKNIVREIKAAISKVMGVKDEGTLSKHLGVTYEFQGDGSLIMQQSEYIKDIIDTYEDMFGPCKSFSTPGYPGTTLSRADKENEEPVLLSEYRSFVGKILFAMKKTYPEIANAVRELAGHMDFPTEEHWKSAARLVGYLKYKAIHGLTYKTPRSYEIVGFVDTDYATNKDTRKSTTGYLLTFGGCLVSWLSKAQPSVTLSSTEAEYVGASTLATEIQFVIMMLQEMKIKFPLPAKLYEDNTGAIYLMNNNQVGPRTKHISVKFHHVRNMIYEGDLIPIYTRSGDNPSDIMTKNTTEAIQGKHEKKIKSGDLLLCIVNIDDQLNCITECQMAKCGQLAVKDDFPVECNTTGATYCKLCDAYFVTSAHEGTYKHLEYHTFEVLKEMARNIDAVNREDVVNIRCTAIRDSIGTVLVNETAVMSCVNRSINNDNEGHQEGMHEEETSDTTISKREMVCYTGKMYSDVSLSEVKEEEEHLMENVIRSYYKDAG